MRRQYLGDEKDAFKWDYHNFLAHQTGVGVARLLFMLTRNNEDKPWEGSSDPRNFKGADERIYSLCDALKFSKTEGWMFLDIIRDLPGDEGGYRVQTDRDAERDFYEDRDREKYFAKLAPGDGDELVFIDPNTGFEKVGGATASHVHYGDIENVMSRLSENSLISVYQRSAYRPFGEHFRAIQENLSLHSTALYWNGAGRGGLMFVVAGRSAQRIAEVAEWNREYVRAHPAVIIADGAEK